MMKKYVNIFFTIELYLIFYLKQNNHKYRLSLDIKHSLLQLSISL